MTTVDDMLFHLGGVPVLAGIPFSGTSKAFFVDPVNGSSTYEGTTPQRAKASIADAYALTTDAANDVIFFIGGGTADTLTTALTWSNSYTHLVGLSSPLPGCGQRCRVIGGSTTDLTVVVTVSGTGCIFKNIKFSNETDANADSGALVVSGNRNAFLNCEISGMIHATPGARAGSYSLTVSGAENFFERCHIGTDTIVRAAANSELQMSGSKNTFLSCRFVSYSETAGKFAMTVSGAGTNWWKDCIWQNMSVNWAQDLTNAINVSATSTHYVVLQWPYQFIGFTGVANTLTHIYMNGPVASTTSGLSTQPAG